MRASNAEVLKAVREELEHAGFIDAAIQVAAIKPDSERGDAFVDALRKAVFR